MTSASDAFPTPSGMSGTARSAELFAEARELIPGGVNSPVRAFNSVGYRLDVFPAMTPTFPTTGVSGHAGAIQ